MAKVIVEYARNPVVRSLYRIHRKLLSTSRYQKRSGLRFLSRTYDLPDGPSAYYSFKEIWDDEIYYFEAENDTPVIIDCGANVGISVSYFKHLYPESKVLAFEADPEIYDYLRLNIEKNRLKNVVIQNKAVWIDNSEVSFDHEGADAGRISKSSSSFSVQAVRLKDILTKYEIVDFLKIDIEGAEYQVLRDCAEEIATKVKNLFCEYHSFPDQNQELGSLLELLSNAHFRYKIYHLDQSKKPILEFDHHKQMDLQLNILAVNQSL